MKNIFKQDGTKSIDKATNEFSQKIMADAKQKGKNSGLSDSIDSESEIIKLPVVSSLLARSSAFLNDLSGSLERDLQEYYTKYKQSFKALTKNNFIQSKLNKKEQLKTDKQNEIKAVDISVQERKKENEAEQKNTINGIKKNDIEIAEYPFTKVTTTVILSVLLIVGILSSEAFVNQKAFLFQKGENFITSLTIAIGISFATYLLGYASAKIVRNKKLEVQHKILGVVGISLVALGVYYGIAELRVSMMETLSEGQTGRNAFVVSKFTLILINVGFYVALIIVKLMMYPKKSVFENNAKHKAIKKDTAKKKSKLESLKKEYKQFPTVAKKEKNEISKRFDQQIAKEEAEIQQNYKEIKTHQVKFNKVLSVGINLYNQVNQIALQSVGVYIEQTNLFSDFKTPLKMEVSDIPKLDNPFANYTYIEEEEVEQLFRPELQIIQNKNQYENISVESYI